MPRDSRLIALEEDGRRTIERPENSGRYKLIAIDAYDAEGIPAALRGADFFALVKNDLAAGGLLVANIAGNSAEEDRELRRELLVAFSEARCFHAKESTNVIVIAAKDGAESLDKLAERIKKDANKLSEKLGYDLTPALDQEIKCLP